MPKEPIKFNPNEWVPAVMALGTWLFVMYQEMQGIHYMPDKWILTIILTPYGAKVYSMARDKITETIRKRLPKKPD